MPSSTTYPTTRTLRGPARHCCGHCGREQPCGCAACTDLKCLCRPRFFAGQLLTEKDLNQLDRYMVEKQKLHNRYLHGWGTVCGLSVRCDPCGEGLIVGEGYALSPCGHDIVVCDDSPVDICTLIGECKETEKDPCQPPYPNNQTPCDGETEDWILAICYDEQPSRGIGALHQPAKKSCGCGCGSHNGNGNGRCSCGGQCTCRTDPVKPQPAQCEPTLVCEGYCYTAYRAPLASDPGSDDNSLLRGEFAESRMGRRFLECLGELFEALAAEPEDGDVAKRYAWICATRERLWRFFSTHPFTECNWKERLEGLYCPDPNALPGHTFEAYYGRATIELMMLFLEYLVHCFCESLLPPCPEAPASDCVPLARVTLRRSDCKVIHVCNWTTERHFVMTFPTLSYWLEPTGLKQSIREILDWACCDIFGMRSRVKGWTDAMDAAAGGELASEDIGAAEQPFNVEIIGDAVERNDTASSGRSFWSQGSQQMRFSNVPLSASLRSKRAGSLIAQSIFAEREPLSLNQLFNGILGGKDAEGNELMSSVERDNLMGYLGLQYLATPFVRNALPDDMMALAGLASDFVRTGRTEDSLDMAWVRRTMGGPAKATDAAGTADVEKITEELAQLRQHVARQEARIDELSK